MELKGKHVLVTGSAKRIGRAIAEALLKEGVKLSAHYNTSKKEADELVSLAAKYGGQCKTIQTDISKVDEIKRAVKETVSYHGNIDILINSASDFLPTPIDSITEKDWDHLLNVNLKGQFFVAMECAKAMNPGVIINIADAIASHPIKKHAAYGISKAAVIAMTQSLAKELAPKIRVNCISPGWILSHPQATLEQEERALKKSLLKRLGKPEDVVSALFFLIQNDFVTGFNLIVDGGSS